mmetsp:Transcript_31249/g.93787  ORF Transcript_31249/g.93787 Transcript_31249/m.93787 type:complete len:1028 (+) Transcript_31249:231-3314(+)
MAVSQPHGILVEGIRSSLRVPETDDARNQFSIGLLNDVKETFVCEGIYGPVSSGVVQGLPNSGGAIVGVTIKRISEHLNGPARQRAVADMLAEARALAMVASPFVLELIGVGVTDHDEPECVLLRQYEQADLQTYLRRHRGVPDEGRPHGIVVHRRAQMAVDAVRAMEHLGRLGVVLRDVGARSFLVDRGGAVVVGDLGDARREQRSDYWVKNPKVDRLAVPLRWLAPEVLTIVAKDPAQWGKPGPVLRRLTTAEADVWSFGVTLWELCTCGAVPYGQTTEAKIITMAKKGTLQLSGCGDFPRPMEDIVALCTSADRAARPTFAVVERHLLELKQSADESPAAPAPPRRGQLAGAAGSPKSILRKASTAPGNPRATARDSPRFARFNTDSAAANGGGGSPTTSPMMPQRIAILGDGSPGASPRPQHRGSDAPKPPPRFTREATSPDAGRRPTVDTIAGTEVNAHDFIDDRMLDALVESMDSFAAGAPVNEVLLQSDPESDGDSARGDTESSSARSSASSDPPSAFQNKRQKSKSARLPKKSSAGDSKELHRMKVNSLPTASPVGALLARLSPRLRQKRDGAGRPNKKKPKRVEAKLKTAARKGHYGAVCGILDKAQGLDVDATRIGGSLRTPLFCAAEGGYTSIVARLLEARADPLKLARNGHTALEAARAKGHQDVVRRLQDAVDCRGNRESVMSLGEFHADTASHGGSTDSLADEGLCSSEPPLGDSDATPPTTPVTPMTTSMAAAPPTASAGADADATAPPTPTISVSHAVEQPTEPAAAAAAAGDGEDMYLVPAEAVASTESKPAVSVAPGAAAPSGDTADGRPSVVDPRLLSSISNAYQDALKRAENISIVPVVGSAEVSAREQPLYDARGPPPGYSTAPHYEAVAGEVEEPDMYGVVLSASEKMVQECFNVNSATNPYEEVESGKAQPERPLSDAYAAVTNGAVDLDALAAAKADGLSRAQERQARVARELAKTRARVLSPQSVVADEEEWVPPTVVSEDAPARAAREAELAYEELRSART